MTWRLEIPKTTDPIHIPYLREAYAYAGQYSGDTRTHTGAVITQAPGMAVLTRGVNHFPPCLDEALKEPPHKYQHIIHAEVDAITKAAPQFAAIDTARKAGLEVGGLTMYLPWWPCDPCAHTIAGAHIDRLVVHEQQVRMTPERWHGSLVEAQRTLQAKGVELLAYDGLLGGVEHLFNGERWHP